MTGGKEHGPQAPVTEEMKALHNDTGPDIF